MPRGYILVYILALGLAVSLLGLVWFFQNNSSKTPTASFVNNRKLTELSQKLIGKKIEAAKWKTYQNSQFGFELTYPAYGIVLEEKDNTEGECGQSIKEQKGQILVDNFFEVKVMEGQKSVEDYLESVGARDQYNLESFPGLGADEAVEVLGLKKGAEYAVGYPPLVYVTHIFRKGDRIFLIKDFLHSENIGGCINPKVLDPVRYPQFDNKDWDLKRSFVFFQVKSGDQPVSTCGACPKFSPPSLDFCKNGKIVPGVKNSCGCQLPPSCLP